MSRRLDLVERVRRILSDPKREWPVIDAEVIPPADLYRGYIVPLAAIGPIASAIGLSLVGVSLPVVGTVRVPFGSALAAAIVNYGLGLLGVYLVALVADALAPRFGGERSVPQALKAVAFGSTASWVGAVFAIVPALSLLSLLASIYSLYLLYLGLPLLMRVPRDRALAYTAVVVLAALVVFLVVGLLASPALDVPGRLPGG